MPARSFNHMRILSNEQKKCIKNCYEMCSQIQYIDMCARANVPVRTYSLQ